MNPATHEPRQILGTGWIFKFIDFQFCGVNWEIRRLPLEAVAINLLIINSI